jgi:hypothetical protein
MYSTVRDAITETARAVGLTNASGMTPYSDELVTAYLASTHVLIRDEIEWGELTQTFIRSLDGVTGRITQTIAGVSDWKRIRRIYQEGFQTPLPMLTTYLNPLESSLLLGYSAIPPQDDLQPPAVGRYLVQFQPLTSTSRVLLQVDREVDWSDDTQILPIDFWLHVWGAAMMWGAADAANQAQLEQNTRLFSSRMKQVKARENSRPSFSNPNQLQPNDWWEQGAPYA